MNFIKILIFVFFISGSPKLLMGQYISGQRDLLNYFDALGGKHTVHSFYDWQIRRSQILDSMQALFGPLPENPAQPPFVSDLPEYPDFDLQIRDSLETRFYTRYNIRFIVAEGEEVTAYLYLPHNQNKRHPAVIACHPTGLQGKDIVDDQGPHLNRGYGKELAERGYVVIAPDYPSFGDQQDYDFETDRYESGVMKGVFDNIRCVDFLQTLKEVDPERIGIIGHSLGGHTAMFTAAFEPRIKVIVSSAGWTLFSYYDIGGKNSKEDGKLLPWAQKRYAPYVSDKYKSNSENMPFDFDELIAVIAPRPFFSNSPVHDANFNVEGVRIGIANASRVYQFMKAEDHLQVRYPVASHNFPPEERFEAYAFLDRFLKDNLTENN